ncbi:alpha/beta fold hydrolase [Sphingomonas crusticola]|uniref:S9 family peptidase n=1 Tax=Sphingomonas crusticola TaxID=1697973 RepID=UPI000E25E968|nr:alpha/beta fold hydrolase [Sphingomonas crusticola]
MLKRLSMLAGFAAMALPVLAAAPATPPGLESFLAYKFVGSLTAPEAGDRVAWMELHKGLRSIWLAQGPDYRPRQLVAGKSDDGQDLSELAFSPDGRTLVWVRGAVDHNGWANGLPAANPASAVVQPQMEIWASVDGRAPVKVGEGEEPIVSASGRIAFLRDNQVWTVAADGKGKPEKLFYDRGKIDSLAWSPDGVRLAFVSRRGDHSFIGVYGGPDRPISWLAPATAFDDSPVWSPDGRHVAFARRLGIADALASPLLATPNPFSLWVASPDDGTGRLVWQSPTTPEGSYPAVPDGLFLMWGAGDRLIFRAEMDGWPHLYSIPAGGGQPLLLTPGPFMVEHVTLTPDRTALLYSANTGGAAGDIDRRHLFRVAVDRPGPLALSSGTGLEWLPTPLAGGKLAYVASTPAVPPRVALASAAGRGPDFLSTTDASFPSNVLVAPKPVTFTARDGLTIHGQLFLPQRRAGKHPGLIFVHGGPPRQMLLGWSYMDYYTHSYAMNQYLASRGYAVLSVNYRLGIGYGRAFQHPAKAGAIGNSEYQDVVAGAHFLQALPEVDGGRIGIWGGSYGGLLTAQALARDSDLFKAGVDFHGVHDWSIGRNAPPRYEQGDYAALMKLAFESSPEAALKNWRSPVLLIQGDDDRNVRFEQTVDLARRLAAQGTAYEELIFPNEVHGFLRYDTWLRADAAMVRFLDAQLKP